MRVPVAIEHGARVRWRTANLALSESGIVDIGWQGGGEGGKQEDGKEGHDGADERLHRGGGESRQGRSGQGVAVCCKEDRACVAADEEDDGEEYVGGRRSEGLKWAGRFQ